VNTPILAGEHKIVVLICGSFKNLLGPHHDPDRPRLIAWPGNWREAPAYGPPAAEAYDFIDYGLMGEFTVDILR
jgi:hypothetical protein